MPGWTGSVQEKILTDPRYWDYANEFLSHLLYPHANSMPEIGDCDPRTASYVRFIVAHDYIVQE